MTKHKAFNQPVVRSIFSIAEEKIYDFQRRTVFSPVTTDNCTIRFCTVSGIKQSTSQTHTHPGDELVFTLEGSNTNNSGGKDFILRRYQAISIPPGTRHRTVVTTGLWKGLSFYCDDCPLLFENPPEARTDIVIKSLDDRISVLNHLQKKPIFSPASQESSLMELYFLFSNSPVPATHFMHAGETVLYVISGAASLCWEPHCRIELQSEMAAAIPAGFSYQLASDDPDGCRIIAASCSSCPIFQAHTG